MSTDELNSYIKENLSKKRYLHSVGVADTAKKLAEILGVDTNKAYKAGLLHDCAKEIPYDAALEMLRRYNIKLDELTMASPPLIHGPLGACIVKNELKICDDEIYDAIRFHTTGKANMSDLTKIIYLADYIEPGRTLDGIDKLREMAFAKRIDEAIVLVAAKTIMYSLTEGKTVHPDTVHARNYILINLQK